MRHRLIAGHACIALILAIGAATSVIALRSTARESERVQHVNNRLAGIDGLRTELRELGIAVRAHVLNGDVATQQHVFDVLQRIASSREQLRARETLANGGAFEADIDDYVAALLTVMSHEASDPMARIVEFEEVLTRVRSQLDKRLSGVVHTERSRRDSARSVQTLTLRAQWTIIVASALGIVLVIIMARRALAQPTPKESLPAFAAAPSEPTLLKS